MISFFSFARENFEQNSSHATKINNGFPRDIPYIAMTTGEAKLTISQIDFLIFARADQICINNYFNSAKDFQLAKGIKNADFIKIDGRGYEEQITEQVIAYTKKLIPTVTFMIAGGLIGASIAGIRAAIEGIVAGGSIVTVWISGKGFVSSYTQQVENMPIKGTWFQHYIYFKEIQCNI